MTQSPQALPVRTVDLGTRDPDELAALQPERPRSIVQLEPGEFSLRLREITWGRGGIQSERWSRGIRVIQGRPESYLCFAFVTAGSARWMGAPIAPGSVLRIDGSWDCATEGVFAYVAFAVPRALHEAESVLRDPDRPSFSSGNRVGRRLDAPLVAMRLLGSLALLERDALQPATIAAVGEEMLALASILDRAPDRPPATRESTSKGRLAAVRRIEAYLEAAGAAEIPSIPFLCQVAGVGERTLEYAFREHLGVTPVRYLKLRRLSLARRRLEHAQHEDASVTETAIACGFLELGRFAGDYRKLFGELPSETLARSPAGQRASARSRRSSRRAEEARDVTSQKKNCPLNPRMPAGS